MTPYGGTKMAQIARERDEALAEIERLRAALREAREIIQCEFSGDPSEPWGFIDELLASE